MNNNVTDIFNTRKDPEPLISHYTPMALDRQQSITLTSKLTCNVNTTDNNNPSFHSRRKVRRRGSFAAELLHGRKNLLGYLLFFLLLYLTGLITFVDPISAIFYKPSSPGSVYKSHEIFDKLWPQIQSDNSSAIQVALLIIYYIFSYLLLKFYSAEEFLFLTVFLYPLS